jgi:hypothetical protein
MAQVSITGKIKMVGKTQQISEKFSKRELVIAEPSGQREQFIPVEFTQDRTGLLDGFNPGEEVSVTCFVNGREWTGKDGVTKYFLSLSGNRIERVGVSGGTGYEKAPPPSLSDLPPVGGDEDDLPF